VQAPLVSNAKDSAPDYFYPHNSNPNPANAAALLKQEEAATLAAGRPPRSSLRSSSSVSGALQVAESVIFQDLRYLQIL
jgi:hypothetical protein